MINLTLEQWSFLAEIVVALLTLIGILVSLWLSISALREVQLDRKLRQKPFLAFEPGGHRMPIEFKAMGKSVPGLNPAFVQKTFSDLPINAESVRLLKVKREDGSQNLILYGHLKNYGLGPALCTEIVWIPKSIWVGSEEFSIDEKKLLQPIYHKDLNTLPASPSHILPGEESKLSRLPTFIVLDVEKKLTRVDGVLEIAYEDVFNQKHKTMQEFHLFTNYNNEHPNVHVTFSDLVKIDKDAAAIVGPNQPGKLPGLGNKNSLMDFFG